MTTPLPKNPAVDGWPALNWREWALLVDALRPSLEGLFVDRIVVPERPRFPGGYVKGEWSIRLTGRRQGASHDLSLLFSIRPRRAYLALAPEGRAPRAAPLGTRSPFDLNLSKQLRGARLLSCRALPRERVLVLAFASPAGVGEAPLGLVLSMIPTAPEALLVQLPRSADPGGRRPPTATAASDDSPGPGEERWPIIAASRTSRGAEGALPYYAPPDGRQAPEAPPVRAELVGHARDYSDLIERELAREAFALRRTGVLKLLREQTKLARERIRQNEASVREAGQEAEWSRYGDLLKANLYGDREPPIGPSRDPKDPARLVRQVTDFETDDLVEIPADPKLGARAQVEKFYQLSRRKQRRMSEARLRLETFRETLARLEAAAEALPEADDWAALERAERAANPAAGAATGAPLTGSHSKKAGAWLGKTFVSKDGWAIWVGRSRDENLELTFKHARGNDLWLHVRGRPGAHAVIPVQPGKSAPLETLLDAAALTVYYSGGEKWGKTEVDYTFKKHVRRIRDSTEASYTNNKTLLIEPDTLRLRRLLNAGGATPGSAGAGPAG